MKSRISLGTFSFAFSMSLFAFFPVNKVLSPCGFNRHRVRIGTQAGISIVTGITPALRQPRIPRRLNGHCQRNEQCPQRTHSLTSQSMISLRRQSSGLQPPVSSLRSPAFLGAGVCKEISAAHVAAEFSSHSILRIPQPEFEAVVGSRADAGMVLSGLVLRVGEATHSAASEATAAMCRMWRHDASGRNDGSARARVVLSTTAQPQPAVSRFRVRRLLVDKLLRSIRSLETQH